MAVFGIRPCMDVSIPPNGSGVASLGWSRKYIARIRPQRQARSMYQALHGSHHRTEQYSIDFAFCQEELDM